jgi:two-component system phosphate regulon response regulator PhoB
MAKANILVVEDEGAILELITYNLKKEGFEVTGITSGEEALRVIPVLQPDLVVLDLMLPGLDGMEVCKFIKQNPQIAQTHVLMLTAKGDDTDIVTGLELGADDYMTKPFSPQVLKARIKAVLRRGLNKEPVGHVLNVPNLSIHPGKREVRVMGEPVSLTNMEFKILHFLAAHRGWAYTRAQIVAGVRGDNFAVTDRSVDTLIVGLRKKLGPCSHQVETVRGVGYRFKE